MAGAFFWSALSASGATLTLTTNAPTPGTDDVYNFGGGANDDANIGNGADASTYIAPDRNTQGQTFTTGSGPTNGFLLTDIWIRHCGYTAQAGSGNGTWWNLTAGAQYTIRVTDPTKTNSAGFVLTSETYTGTGTELYGAHWTGGSGIANLGDDVWLHFNLAAPVGLAINAQYGIDITATAAGGGNFFEWLGNRTNVLANGTAYTGLAAGRPGTNVTFVTGDRVFLARLITNDIPPQVTPSLTSANRFAPVGQTVQVTVTIPAIANAKQTAYLDLTTDNAGIVAFSAGGQTTNRLTFATGATNVQTFSAYVLGTGAANLTVVTNASFSYASITIGTPVAAVEQFEYDSSTQPLLDQANGGSGFSAAWSEPNLADAIIPGLTHNGLINPATTVASSSNAVGVAGSADTAFRTLQGTFGGVGGGTVYVSFLVQSPSGLYDWGGLSLFNGTSESLFMGMVYSLSANHTWGFLSGGSTYMNFSGSVTPVGQVDLLVYRIDFPATNGGSAKVSIYVNPPLNSSEPYSPTGSGNVNSFTFDRIRLGGNDTIYFDEIRVDTQWTNVVKFIGDPEPLGPAIPTLTATARFVPLGQTMAVTASIPTNAPRPVVMTITNDNPTAFSLSSTNAAQVTLTFGVGATNVQTFNVQSLLFGTANLTVISNAYVDTATLQIASQVSASEPFEYEAGTDNLAGSLGGAGFDVNAWTGGGSVFSPGLAYPGLISSSNAAVIVASGSGNAARVFALSASPTLYGGVDGGTVWVSFLIQGAFPETQQSAGVSIMEGTTERFFMGLTTAEPNNGKWGCRGVGQGFNTFDNSVAPNTNTDLLVFRLDFPTVPGDLIGITFYADPPAGTTPPATPTGTVAVNNFTFDSIRLGTDFNMNFDEIRVGGTWAEVVPSLPVLSVQKLAGDQVQIAWPASSSLSLYSSTNLTGPWAPAGLSVTTQNGQKIVTDATSGRAKFYRLQ